MLWETICEQKRTMIFTSQPNLTGCILHSFVSMESMGRMLEEQKLVCNNRNEHLSAASLEASIQDLSVEISKASAPCRQPLKHHLASLARQFLAASQRASSGSVGARWVTSGHIGFRRVSVGTLFWHDGTRQGSTDRSTVPYRCTTHVRTHTGPSGVPTGPPGPRRDPTDPLRHRRIPFHRRLPGLGGPQLLLASAVATCKKLSLRRALSEKGGIFIQGPSYNTSSHG